MIKKQNKPLEHAGILGMRWGVRRRAKGPVMTSVRGKIVPATTSVRGKSTPVIGGKTKKRKKLSEMSDDELKKIATRLQLEKQYKDLTKKDISSGKKFVSEVLVGAGKQVAISYVSKYLGKGIEVLLSAGGIKI